MNELFRSHESRESTESEHSNFEFQDFSPEQTPETPTLFARAYRDSELVLRSGVAPVLVESQKLRRKPVCSAMVQKFILREYGAEHVESLLRADSLDAWDYKEVGLRSGELQVGASSLSTMQLRGRRMQITDGPGYRRQMADVLSQPGIVLIYHRRTSYFGHVLRSNHGRAEEHKSYNSHIGYNIGMKLQRDVIDRSAGKTLSRYLGDKSKYLIQPENPYNLEVIRDGVSIEYTADTILRNQDYVQYNEPQILHYYGKRGERIDGAFTIASWGDYFNERLESTTMESETSEASELTQEVSGYLQLSYIRGGRVRRFRSVHQLLKTKLNLNDQDIQSYLLALEVIGLPGNKITPTTLIPRLTMQQVHQLLDRYGGQEHLERYINESKLRFILENNPGLVGAVVQKNATVTSHFQFVFDIVEQTVPQLGGTEKRLILQMIDQSIQSIDLTSRSLNFGQITTISEQRVSEIAQTIKDIRDRTFENVTSPELRNQEEVFDFINYMIDKISRQFRLTATDSNLFSNFERIEIIQHLDQSFSIEDIRRGNYKININMQELYEIVNEITRRKLNYYENTNTDFSVYHDGQSIELNPTDSMVSAVRKVTSDNLLRTIILSSHVLEVRRPGIIRSTAKAIARPFGLVRSAGELQTRASSGNLLRVVQFYKRFKDSQQPRVMSVISEIESHPLFSRLINSEDNVLRDLSRLQSRINRLFKGSIKVSNNPQYSEQFVEFDNKVRELIDLPLNIGTSDRLLSVFDGNIDMEEFLQEIKAQNPRGNRLLEIAKSDEFQNLIKGLFTTSMNKQKFYIVFMNCVRIYTNQSLNLQAKQSRIRRYSELTARQLPLESQLDDRMSDFRDILGDSEVISSIVSVENMTDDMNALNDIAFIHGQTFDPSRNWVAYRMLLTCHNRGLGNVLMSIAENFSYKLLTLTADRSSDSNLIQQSDIDSLKNPQTMALNKIKIYRTIKSVALELKRNRKLGSNWNSRRIESQARLILQSGGPKKLLSSPLLVELNQIYARENGSPIGITFDTADMRNDLFSYGGKLIRSQADLDRLRGIDSI